jgi:hypothetical protein
MGAAGRLALLVLLLLLAVASCNGTTGYEVVTFYSKAVGPADAVKGQPYKFGPTDHGWMVELDSAVIHIGAIYLDQSVPTSGQQQEPCTLPGTYVGEVRAGADIDMLSPEPQLLPITGYGSTIPAAAAQVWLTHGDVFAQNDVIPVLTLDGIATQGAQSIHFQAGVTIDANRSVVPPGSALPGENPICQTRIVSPIPVDVTLSQSGTLLLHLDPTALFDNVDFSTLPLLGGDPVLFTNDTTNQASINLFHNLTAAGPVYRFEFQPATP